MEKFIIAPEGGKWTEREAATPRAAYCLECSWIQPATRTAVIDATGQAHIYTRDLDPAGNLLRVNELN